MPPPYIFKTVYYFTCEGRSEEELLQKLNKYLEKLGVAIVLRVVGSRQRGGANRDALKKKHSSWPFKKSDVRFFVIDNDLVHRGKLKLADLLCLDSGAGVLLNTQNYEDFLALTLPPDKARQWHEIMAKEGHFREPLPAKTYQPLFRQIVPRYEKGRLPEDFDAQTALRNLRANMADPAVYTQERQENEFALFIKDKVLPLLPS